MPPIRPPVLRPFVQRFLAEAPGWVFLFCGASLIAAVVLGRGRLENAPLIWQRDLLRTQARQLEARRDAYKTLHAALDVGDPVVLERLAFDHLNLQPRDRLLLEGQLQPRIRRPSPRSIADDVSAAPTVDRSVAASLSLPLVREGIEYVPFTPDRSLLARLARGASAPGLVLVGGMLILAGLWWSPGAALSRQSQSPG